MTAKEMFEQLGYKQMPNSSLGITYYNDSFTIYFFSLTNQYSKVSSTSDKASVAIGVDEHKAIAKQLEELGW